MPDSSTNPPRAVILTALRVEYQAVRAHLTRIREETHPQGTIYECGIFTSEKQEWDVGIVEIGAGNVEAALEAERAITYFQPKLMFFVGVAGGLKDVALGDVVVATKVYGYESGKANRAFLPRPEVGNSSFHLQHRARAEARKQDWLQRLGSLAPDPAPRVFVAPIAAGEKVVSSKHSAFWKFLTTNYSDALAVEMESYGFLKVALANQQVHALVIRGISDLIDDKTEADAANTQELAARHASAFAFEVLARSGQEKTYEDFTQSQRDFKEFKDKDEGKWEKPSDDSGDDTAQNKKSKDTGERISKTLKKERQIITFFTGSESKVETTKLPETEEEFTEWYYGLGDYEQYYVLTAAVLHGAPVREVVKRTDSLYQFIRDEVERRGNLLRSRSHQGDQWETQQRESIRFSDPLLRTISGRELRKITYTKTRRERGVERLYWQDADAYGLSTFGLHLLEFLCNEFISRGELGQFFLNALQQWSEESTGEVSRKATHSYGVVLWCHDAIELKRIAKKWAKENSPRHTAELLDGAYEIYRVKSIEKAGDGETSSDVLEELKSWVKIVHRKLGTGEAESSILDTGEAGSRKGKDENQAREAESRKGGDESQTNEEESRKGKDENQAKDAESSKGKDENQAQEAESGKGRDASQAQEAEITIEEAINIGCAVANTYTLIGKISPDIALEGLERLLKLALSNSTIDIDDIVDAGVSTYVILTWSGRVREVIEHLAASAEQLSHTRNLPRASKKRQEYRRQREVYLNATLEAFFLVATESLTDVQKIQNIRYSLDEPLPPQPAIPDPVGRDVLLAFLLSRSEARCQKYIMTLLCAAIVERKSKHAFGLLRYWAEIVLRIHSTQDKDAEETYVTFLQFIVYLGRTVDEWCHDLQEQGLHPPPAVETFKKRLKQWCIEGSFYSHPIGSFAQEVLYQLSD